MMGFGHRRDNRRKVQQLEAAEAAEGMSIVPPLRAFSWYALDRGVWYRREIRHDLGHRSRCRKTDDYNTAKECERVASDGGKTGLQGSGLCKLQ